MRQSWAWPHWGRRRACSPPSQSNPTARLWRSMASAREAARVMPYSAVEDSPSVNGLVTGMIVKDFRMPKEVMLTPGTGMVNFPEVFRRLKKGGFTGGPLVVECLEPGDPKQTMAEARKVRTFLETRMIRIPRLCYIQHIGDTAQRTRNMDIHRHVRSIRSHYDWMIHKKYYNHFGTWYWSEWSKVGGELTSPPHCVYLRTSDTHASGNGDAHCFAKGRNNHLIHITYNYKWYCPPCNYSNSWGEWEDLGGDLKSSPYCIARGSNRIDCFAQNKNNQMAHIWWDGSAWSGWQEAEGKVLPNYAVAYAISEWDGNVCQSCESLEIMPDLTNNWLTGMGSYGWSIGKNYEENVFNTKMADPSRQTWGWDNSEGGINGIGLDTSHAAIIATHGSSTSDKGWCGTMHTDVGHGTEICAAEMMKIGSSSGGRLRFLHLITCHSIQYEHREKWFDAAEGKIHLITGFHGSPWVGEHHVNDYLGVGFFGFWFGVGNVWVELTYHNNYSYDYFNDTCPISLGFGATPQDADNAAYNEKYSDHWNDQDPIWMTVHYISGCDPENGGELP